MTLAVLATLFIWWFSTGAILLLIGKGAGRTTVWASAPLAGWAAWTVVHAAQFETIEAAFVGFAAAISVWGWFELAFLTGVITGPNRAHCPKGLDGSQHFRAAWNTVSHHEIAVFCVALGFMVLLWNSPNQTGLWCFVTLFVARISAKLNIYLGVPNFTDDMLPRQVSHLRSYFAKRRMNLLFPFSITALTLATAHWVGIALAAPAWTGVEIGSTLVATLTYLALLEHWLMVLPVRDSLLWQWMTTKRGADSPKQAKIGRVSGGTHGL
ncbi:MAG: putative photosynthetic complex assembly protein PuhE [Pseudomonadota bacterium]